MVSVTEEHRMAATTQAPIKVSLEIKDKIHYLAAFEEASQAEIAPVLIGKRRQLADVRAALYAVAVR